MRNLLTLIAVASMGVSSVAFAKGTSNVECDQKVGSSIASLDQSKSQRIVDSLLVADSGSVRQSKTSNKARR